LLLKSNHHPALFLFTFHNKGRQTMTDESKDLGIAVVLLQQLSDETLPKGLEIKARLNQGERLDHWDIAFLEDLFKRAEQIRPLVDRHPEYQTVYAQAIHLYKEITDQALLNEKSSA
jgi:hypothetical protein